LLAQQQSNAKERVFALEKAFGTLQVSGPEKTKVQLDSLTEVGVPARLHASPGAHVLSIRFPDSPVEKRDVALEVGRVTTLELTKQVAVTPPSKETAPPLAVAPIEKPPEKSPVPITRYIGFAAIGAGVVAGVSTLILGLSALDAGKAYDASPSIEALHHANALATWTNVAWVTGAVLVAGGVALVLIPGPKAAPNAALTVRPGGITLEGTF